MKATANSGSNIAFVKYWGVREDENGQHVALNPSVSMTLQTARTSTTVEFDPRLLGDICTINDRVASPETLTRVRKVLQRVRELASLSTFARVASLNHLPTSVGLASSASGFCALALAAARAAGLPSEPATLVPLAILGSGSACRSLYGGFVLWTPSGNGNRESTVEQLATEREWALMDLVAIVSKAEKKISSARGHLLARTSPLLDARLAALAGRTARVRQAIRNRDLAVLGPAIEEDTLSMHAVMMTSQPPLLYWEPATVTLIRTVRELRERARLRCYFTIDAGPNVHVITGREDAEAVGRELQAVPGVMEVLRLEPGPGAYLSDDHLF